MRSILVRPTSRDLMMAIAVIAVGAVISGSNSAYHAQLWSQWITYGLLALSLAFVWGRGGLFSFGQAAFFGIGAYTYGIVAINLVGSTGESVSAVLAAVLAATLVSGLLGYFMFYGNVGGVYVSIITLATSLVLLTVMSSTAGPQYHIGAALLGGYNGMTGIPPLTVGTPSNSITLTVNQTFLVFIITAVVVTVCLRILMRRPFGRIVTALRNNESRTQLLGYDVRRYKLFTFMIGGCIAGLAGAGYAAWGMFINPVVFGLQQAALVAIWVLMGGRASFVGAFVGVVLISQLSSTVGGSGGTATPIVLGAVLIVVVLFLPAGVVPSLSSLVTRLLPSRWASKTQEPLPRSTATLTGAPIDSAGGVAEEGGGLVATDLIKRFGGLTAVNGVSATFARTGVHCLIGSNGAGKSTFFNLLVGRYRPTSGKVTYLGADVTRWRPDRRARHGMGIKLQVASLYMEATAHENIWLAAYAGSRNVKDADARTEEVLDWLGMQDRRHHLAGVLSHGEKQWLEIGMVVAARPSVILLDEPTAGMTREETARTADLVRTLGQSAAVIVVEHDMEFVRALDCPVTMFHEGKVFATGTLDELRADERVLEIYLGRTADAETH